MTHPSQGQIVPRGCSVFSPPLPPSGALRVAKAHVLRFTSIALATGAAPVSCASAAIIAENAAMVACIASALGVRVSPSAVAASLGTMGAINMVGRTLFVEGARWMGWATGPLGLPAIMAWGAATAALQTWCVGHLAIAVCSNCGVPLTPEESRSVLKEAREEFDASQFRRELKAKRRR